MFGTADLALRLIAATLPSRAGYALTRASSAILGGERRRWIGKVVRDRAGELLADPDRVALAEARFVSEIACDDLDAITANLWPERWRLDATTLEGAEHLPAVGPAVLTSFHFSGGFRVFDVLRRRGLRPTFVHAPPRQVGSLYDATIERLRQRHLARHLSPAYVEPGPGARERLDRHLAEGGVVVALLDVAPTALDLRDRARGTLLGRPLRLPVGLLRLAQTHRAPVIVFDGRVEDDRRVLAFQPPVTGADPETALGEVLSRCEKLIRLRPWTWHAWLDIDALFDEP